MGSKSKNAVSKRRPRQNIISMILKNAKNKGSVASTSTTASSTHSPTANKRSASGGKNSGSGANKGHASSGSSKRGGILKSAVELTRRSKHVTSRRTAVGGRSSKSKRGKRSIPFVKGQKAFYRSAKGIAKVTVVGIHHDAKLEPYYTIKLRDGKEKQTDGKHLTPIQEDVKQSSSSSGKEAKSGSGGNTSRSAAVAGNVTDVSTDPMSDDDDEVIDYTEKENNEAVDEPVAIRGGDSEDGNDTADDEAANDSDDEEDRNAKKFVPGQDAYYRSPQGGNSSSTTTASGGVIKIRIHSYGDNHPNRYTVVHPDGSHEENVRPSLLATLMDLTSKELSVLMKERNKRQHGNNNNAHSPGVSVSGASRASRSRPLASSKSSSYGEDSTAADDEGYDAEEGEPTSSGSEQSLTPGVETTTSALPPAMKMVEAKTEDGGTKMVPYYNTGMDVYYKNFQGVQSAKILSVHLDDLMEPYYDVRLADGKEKQTDNAHIMLMKGDEEEVEKAEDAGGDAEAQDQTQEEEVHEEEANVIQAEPEEEVEEEVIHYTLKESRQRQPRRHSVSNHVRRGQSAQRTDGRNSALRQSLKDMVEEQLAPSHTFDKVNVSLTDKVPDPVGNNSNESYARNHQDTSVNCGTSTLDPSVASVLLPTTFSLGDEVLYTSSQGEQCRAVVVRLQRDKKNRPYYVVRLPKGKEKQVYGHRLKPYVRDEEKKLRRARSRSRSAREDKAKEKARGRSSSKASSSGRRHEMAPGERSESMDSKKSGKSTLSNSSRRSKVSRERQAIAREDGSTEPSMREERHHHRARDIPSTRYSPDESVTRTVGTRESHNSESRGSSSSRRNRSPSATPTETTRKSRRDRSLSIMRRSKSNASAASSREPQSASSREAPQSERKHRGSRDRSHSRAPSEDSRQSHGTHATTTTSRGMSRSRRSAPYVSMTSKMASSSSDQLETASKGDDVSMSTGGRSISRLKSFRKNFVASRKKKH